MLRSTPSLARSQKRLLIAVQFLVLLIAVGARLLPGPRTIDDSFITYRYVRNILAGIGFVFNPGEHVLGTTTPLYTILLTILGSLTGGAQAPFPVLAQVTNAVADAITCLLLLQLGKRLGSWRAGLATSLAWAVAPFSVTFAIGGLETSVYILFLVAASSAYLHGKRILTALLAALAVLTRPDALILVGLLAFARLVQAFLAHRQPAEEGTGSEWKKPSPAASRNKTTGFARTVRNIQSPLSNHAQDPSSRQVSSRKSWWKELVPELAAFSLPLVPWLLFSTLYFGSPVPHSIAAKSVAYHLPPTAAFIRLMQHFANPFMEEDAFGSGAIAVGLILYPFLFIIGARRARRAERGAWPLLAYPWLYFAAFALANPLIFRWYLSPPLPLYILILLLGAEQLVMDLTGAVRRTPQTGMARPRSAVLQSLRGTGYALGLLAITVLPFTLNLFAWDLRPDHGLKHPAPHMAWYKLELLYLQAAGSLSQEINQQPGLEIWLAAGDVGVLGFFTPTKILDTVGLNSPQSVSYYPLDPANYAINYAVPPDLINDLQPDYIVILEVYGREGLLKEARFWDKYRLHSKIATDIYGSDGMLIFEKRSEQ